MFLNVFSILTKMEDKKVLLFQEFNWKLFTMLFPKFSHTPCLSSYLGVMPCAPHYTCEENSLRSVIMLYSTCLLFMCALKQICCLEQQNTFLLLLTPTYPEKWRALPSPLTKKTDWKDSVKHLRKAFLKASGIAWGIHTQLARIFFDKDKSREEGDLEWLSKPCYLFRIAS